MPEPRGGLFSGFARRRANRLHEQAHACSEAANDDEALILYHRALKLDPARPSTLFNVGLIHKHRRAWRESFEFNQRALDLAPNDEGTRWNLAIAATALGDWKTARQMWNLCGFDIEPAEGPIAADFGLTPVRLNPAGEEAEVVWGRRLDPVRVRIENIPFAQSGYFYGDVVLHDGAPQGYRLLGEEQRPVFNVFERLSRSEYSTLWSTVSLPSQSDFDELEEACGAAGLRCEDWTSNTRFLCKQCSEGIPHDDHDEELIEPVWVPRHDLAFATPSRSDLEAVLGAWAEAPGREVELLHETD